VTYLEHFSHYSIVRKSTTKTFILSRNTSKICMEGIFIHKKNSYGIIGPQVPNCPPSHMIIVIALMGDPGCITW